MLKDYAKFDGSLSERDHLAIRKTFSGLMKLIYPDGKITDEEAFELIEFAAECRKRVKDQLYVIDETFKAEPAFFKYINLKNGMEINVETLEKVSNALIVPVNAAHVSTEQTEGQPVGIEKKDMDKQQTDSTQPATAPKPKRLASKYVEIRANQSNVSYKRLFGDYLESASHIVITDPYIRAPFQIENLLEFIQTCRECCAKSEELYIELHTQNDDDKVPEMIDTFDDLKDELAAVGIDFAYYFDADHDRNICLDNGWKIVLSRGLDIFDKYSRFSLSAVRQTNRRCREFSVTFIQE